MESNSATTSASESTAIQLSQSNSVATKVAKLLNKIAADEIEKYSMAKTFPFPFFADEELLNKINDEANQCLEKVPANVDCEFKSETRFQDISSNRFNTFDEFIKKAGDKKDPESTNLIWGKFAIDQEGEPVAGEICVLFVTEKRLHTQDDAPGDFNHAYIKLIISGSNLEWVEFTFSNLLPYITSSNLGGLFRPLWIFRNKWFITILAHVISWIGFFIGVHFVSRLFTKDSRLSRAEMLEKILQETDVASKLDLFDKQMLQPSSAHWWEPIVTIAAGGMTFVVMHVIGLSIMPKLAPGSSIAIGLSNRRAEGRLNLFRFIIFTLLVSGIIIPIIRAAMIALF